MKKYNKMFACPTPGGECIFIIAKSKNHMKKILKKSTILATPDEMQFWGKLNNVAKDWETKLKYLIEKSGVCYFVSYGKRYNCLKK